MDVFLIDRVPAAEPRAEEAARIVEVIAGTPTLSRVDAVAREAGMSARGLQRLFAEYVGVGPAGRRGVSCRAE